MILLKRLEYHHLILLNILSVKVKYIIVQPHYRDTRQDCQVVLIRLSQQIY